MRFTELFWRKSDRVKKVLEVSGCEKGIKRCIIRLAFHCPNLPYISWGCCFLLSSLLMILINIFIHSERKTGYVHKSFQVFIEVEVTLQLMISHSVCLGVDATLELVTRL
jgi:hypothetical protein